MTWAQRIRQFLIDLFGSRRLVEMRQERDYFRGRADRLELMLLNPNASRSTMPPVRGTVPGPVGRKRWPDVLAEEIKKNAEREEKEAAAAKAKGTN